MASNQTTGYQLNQWQPEDKVLREEFNADNQRLDSALTGLAGQMGAKASQTEVADIKTQLAAKAAQSALDSLSASVTAGLAEKFGTDFPYVVKGSYTGNGARERTIEIGFPPSLVMIFSWDCSSASQDYAFLLGDDSAQVLVTTSYQTRIVGGMIVGTDTGFMLASQTLPGYFNDLGDNYHYIAFR